MSEGTRRHEFSPTATSSWRSFARSPRKAIPFPSVLAAARGSFTWRTIDAELAELAYDSALDTERLTAVRSADTARLLTFPKGAS